MKTHVHIAAKPRTASLLALCGYFAALFGLFLASELVFAQAASTGDDLGSVASTITGSLSNVAKLIAGAAYVAGVGFALTGMIKFKAHKDNPQQTPLSVPIVLIAIAAGLIFLPSIIKTAGGTLFGGDQTTAGAEGDLGLE